MNENESTRTSDRPASGIFVINVRRELEPPGGQGGVYCGSMLNLLLSVGAYLGVVAALGVAVALMARRDGFEHDIRDDEI